MYTTSTGVSYPFLVLWLCMENKDRGVGGAGNCKIENTKNIVPLGVIFIEKWITDSDKQRQKEKEEKKRKKSNEERKRTKKNEQEEKRR